MQTIPLGELTAAVHAATPAPTTDWRDLASYIADGVARDGAKPFLTWYDDATGERVELSYATFANWVWKTANFLREGLDVQPGDPVVAVLRSHWQTIAVWFGVWSAGAVLVPVEARTLEEYAGAPAVATFVQEDLLPLVTAAPARFGEIVGLALRPMAGRLGSVPPGVSDYATEVPAYGDQLGAASHGVLADGAIPGRTGGQLLAGAQAAAARLALAPADRLLCTLPVTDPDLMVAAVLAVFAAGAGLVITREIDPAGLWRRVRDERVTVLVTDERTLAAAGEPAGVPGLRLTCRAVTG